MGDNNLNFVQIENLDPTEEELEEHWYIDLLSFLRGGLGATP